MTTLPVAPVPAGVYLILEQLLALGDVLAEAKAAEAAARATVARAEASVSLRLQQLDASMSPSGRDLVVWMKDERVALITRADPDREEPAEAAVQIYGAGGQLECLY